MNPLVIRHSPRKIFWLMILVLLIAVAFRFLAIDSAPPGWRDDELIEFGMDQRIVQGWRPLFITEAEGHEPVYHYLHAGTIALFGENIIGYKWLPFAFGLLTIALTFALARRLFDARVGLLAAALMAVSFWPIMYSRLGIRHIGLLPWMLGAFYLLYPRASGPLRFTTRIFDRSPLRIIFAGICLAAGLMTYFAGRAVPIILIGFLIYLLLFNRSILKRVGFPIATAIAIGALIALPMFIQIANTPGSEKRTEVVGGPLTELTKGNLEPAIDTTLGTLGMFTFAGDPESLYNVSGRPVFDWITGVFFYLGILLSLIRLRRVENGFTLVWLVIGIAPAFVSLPAGSFSHTIAALPIVFVVTAVGVMETISFLTDKVTRGQGDREAHRFTLSPLLLVTLSLIVLNSVLTTRDYFGTWAHDDFVRFQYHAPTRDIAKWLDQNPDVVDVAIGTNPNELYLDPVALDLDLVRKDVKARWFNPDRALVLPVDGAIIISSMQTPGVYIDLLLQPLRTDPSTLSTKGMHIFNASHLYQSFNRQPSPATFGGMISLIPDNAPESHPSAIIPVNPGSSIATKFLWRVDKSNLTLRLKSFFHVLNLQNEIVVGEDREDINAFSMMEGDLFLQVSNIDLPTNLVPGIYPTEIGWYNPDSGTRLQLPNGSDHFLTESFKVTAQ